MAARTGNLDGDLVGFLLIDVDGRRVEQRLSYSDMRFLKAMKIGVDAFRRYTSATFDPQVWCGYSTQGSVAKRLEGLFTVAKRYDEKYMRFSGAQYATVLHDLLETPPKRSGPTRKVVSAEIDIWSQRPDALVPLETIRLLYGTLALKAYSKTVCAERSQ
jgi:hypothetical protein